jgi:hypothetical protein
MLESELASRKSEEAMTFQESCSTAPASLVEKILVAVRCGGAAYIREPPRLPKRQPPLVLAWQDAASAKAA